MVAQRVKWAILAILVGLLAAQASADTALELHEYRFITDQSTVEVTGGFAGVDWPLNILGKFGVVTGLNEIRGGPTQPPRLEPYAAFSDVKAILFDPRRASPLPSPGWDLDKTLNLSGLVGTFTVPSDWQFSGVDGQRQPITLKATLAGRLLHLTGANRPGCCDFFNYTVDAWAHQLPWADFNADDRVDAADLTIWRENFGNSVAPGASGDANGDGVVDARDYTVWRDQFGESDGITVADQAGVPEPTTLLLTVISILTCALFLFVHANRDAPRKCVCK